ncbi:hypothetical protein JCM8202_002662 [Rhodotorula sphaerocarpa]
MDLVPHIYHEKQEPGSMLCGQHALNNLLQDNLFTAPDLAEIARSLDALEASQLGAGNHLAGDSPWETSQNYDDSGFFSVQVMEQALKLWNLRLIRWGSQEMQHVHDNPELLDGFLLNHQQHWFSIRRFGTSERFYNLDSCSAEPQWVSPMLLGLTLREAEKQGYSIFALVPASGSGDAAFPRCPAEEVALSLPSPRGGATQYGSTSTAFSGTGYAFNGHGHAGPSGSMSGTAQTGTAPFSTLAAGVSAATGSSRKGKRAASYQGDNGDDDDDVIIEESGRSGSSTVDSESEKRRRRRRLDAGAGAGGDANVTPGLSEEDQMAAAIAASLKVSGNGAAGRSDSGADGTAGKSAATQPSGHAALSEEEEFQRAVRASLAEAGGAGQGGDDGGGNVTESEGSQEPEGEDSPTMEELRQRRLARFGA